MTKEKQKMGRKLLDIDPVQVEKLSAIQCTLREMAAFFGCDAKTLSNRFSTEIAKGKEQGKMSLRRKQYDVAMNGNVSMLIWLGKNYLDQAEKVDANLQQKILQVYGMNPIKHDRSSENPSE